MIAERQKAVGSTTAQKNNQHSEGYNISHDQSSGKLKEQIAGLLLSSRQGRLYEHRE